MNQTNLTIRWSDYSIDKNKPYFELRYCSYPELIYGSNPKGGWNDWLPVALLGQPKEGIVEVEILVDKDKLANKKIIKQVIKNIEFYLIYKNEPDPWDYAIYHSGTMSNAYSNVHWSYFDPEQEDQMV